MASRGARLAIFCAVAASVAGATYEQLDGKSISGFDLGQNAADEATLNAAEEATLLQVREKSSKFASDQTLQRIGDFRFVSLVGLEGSGHHLLTPVLRKIMSIVLSDSQDFGPACHPDTPNASFTGGPELFQAFLMKDNATFLSALLGYARGHVVHFDYSFPHGRYERSLNSKIYNLTALYQMLSAAGVIRKAVIQYDRPLNHSAGSIYKRNRKRFHFRLDEAIKEQIEYRRLIDGHLYSLASQGVPTVKVGIALLRKDCRAFAMTLLQFFRDAKFLLPGSPWLTSHSDGEKKLSDGEKHLMAEVCQFAKPHLRIVCAEPASPANVTTVGVSNTSGSPL